MKNALVAGLAATMTLIAGSAGAQDILQQVTERGTLNCGVNTGRVGFATQDAQGNWQGFDVAMCRAVAAAVLGDPTAVTFVPTTGESRFDALTSGKVDMLARNTPWTFANDVDRDLEFAGVNYYGGQGFMVPQSLGVSSARELNDTSICVREGTAAAENLAEFFRVNNITYTPVPVASGDEATARYLDGACQVFSKDASGLAAVRAAFSNPQAHVILPEIISKEPFGPIVSEGDPQWADIVRWTLNALIAAEELGVTSTNVEELASNAQQPEVRRLLGQASTFGESLGLPPNWAVSAIRSGGNYGEIFARNIGETTPIGLARGLNALWTDGGLMYAPPFR